MIISGRTQVDWLIDMDYNKSVILFLGSSMVEHPAVNRVVVGSSPTRGANSWALSSAVEQGTHNPLAAGSNPAGPTKKVNSRAGYRKW